MAQMNEDMEPIEPCIGKVKVTPEDLEKYKLEYMRRKGLTREQMDFLLSQDIIGMEDSENENFI